MSEPAGLSRVRASDAERERYAARVREAMGEGRLDLTEGDERLAQVYATRFRDELPPLVRDLPDPDHELPGRGKGFPRRPSWESPPGHGRHGRVEYPVEVFWQPYRRRRGRLSEHEGAPEWSGSPWARRVRLFASIAVVLVGIWALTGAGFFWPIFPLAFLAIRLARHVRWSSWHQHQQQQQHHRG